jgi:hypothetical protein
MDVMLSYNPVHTLICNPAITRGSGNCPCGCRGSSALQCAPRTSFDPVLRIAVPVPDLLGGLLPCTASAGPVQGLLTDALWTMLP